MPLSMLSKLGLGALALGGAWWAEKRAKQRKKAVKRGKGIPDCLEGIWSPRQALIPDIYNNLNTAAQSTADQFFGLSLTPAAQGALFEALAETYAQDVSTFTGDAALATMSSLAACNWSAAEWTMTMAEAMASAEAMAMVVLADIQNVVIPFEQPPVEIVMDPEADQCIGEVYVVDALPLHPEILPELSEGARAVAQGFSFHLSQDAQGEAFLHLAQLAANDPGTWNTAPVISTLRSIAPGCAWERKDHYTAGMAELWHDVEVLRDVVATDIGIA